MAQELPATAVKAVDIRCGKRAAKTLAAEIADEILAGGPEVEVGLGPKGRRVLVALLHEPAAEGGDPVLADGDGIIESAAGGRYLVVCMGPCCHFCGRSTVRRRRWRW